MASDLGNSFAKAQNLRQLKGNKVISNSLDRNDKADFVSFKVSARSSLQASIAKLKGNLDLTLFDGNRKSLLSSSNPGKLDESINTVLDPGVYYVKVARQSGASPFKLKLSTSPLAAPNPTTAKFVGLTDSNTLAFFNSDNLNNVTRLAVSGLQAGENLLGIDFRPATGQLFGLGSSNRLYTIDQTTGAATAAGTGTFALPLTGTSFGFDFNPTVDRLRVVSNSGQNLRLNPDTNAVVDANTTLAGLQPDGNLNGATTSITASAYTNSFAGSTTTTLFGIDSTTDRLFTQNPPNAGTQNLVGALNADFADSNGFDIVSSNGVNTAYAASGSSFYTVDLNTGAATQVGTVRDKTVPLNFFGLAARA
ncbi:MAG TPA: DUF4394 domain-containing protein [Trichocoleus sp.]|jgi:hypothetical protein